MLRFNFFTILKSFHTYNILTNFDCNVKKKLEPLRRYRALKLPEGGGG